MFKLFLLGTIAVACLLGCQRVPRPLLNTQDDALFVPLNDPRIVDLSVRTPSSQPAAPPKPPVLVEQGDRATLVYICRETRPDVIAQAIDGLITPEGTVDASTPLNTLIVHDRTDNVKSIAKVIESLDHPVNQLLVEARVLEVTLDDDLEAELDHKLVTAPGSFFQSSDLIDLMTPGATPTVGQGANIAIQTFNGSSVKLSSLVRLLMSRNKARILSSPNLIVSPGSDSSIITGQEVPVQSITTVGSSQSTSTQFKRVGIKLRVNLLQLTDDTARLELNPEVSTVTRFITSGRIEGQDLSNPVVAIRNVTSTLTLKDGEILTVGGLLSTEERKSTRGIPLLQDIPLLGELFRSTRDQQVRTQVIFFLRVHILPNGVRDGIRLLKPDAGLAPVDPYISPRLPPGGKEPKATTDAKEPTQSKDSSDAKNAIEKGKSR